MNNFTSLIFYLLSFSSSALLFYYGLRRKNKVIITLSLSIPILVGGLRYGVGTDYFNYIEVYKRLAHTSFLDFFSLDSNIEIGFYLLIKLSDLITGSALSLFIISSFLTIFFFYQGLKRYNLTHPTLFYSLYLLTVYPVTFNAVRQGIAISICFFAFSFLMRSKMLPFFFWIVAASLFHTTALFLLPIYFIAPIVKHSKNRSFSSYLIKLAALSVTIIFALPILFTLLGTIPYFDKYNQYHDIAATGNNLTFYLKLVIVALIITFGKWTVRKGNVLYLYSLCFAILELITTYLGFMSDPIKRLAIYFSFFSLILIINFIDIFKDRSGRLFIYICIVCYAIAFFSFSYYILGQANVIPYKLVLGEGL